MFLSTFNAYWSYLMSDFYDQINLLAKNAFAHALASGKDIYVLSLTEFYLYEKEEYTPHWAIIGDSIASVADKVGALNALNDTMGEAIREENEKGFTFDELLSIVQNGDVLCVANQR